VDYPHKVFEQGLVNVRSGSKIEDVEKIAFAISHSKTDFTEMKQVLDGLMDSLGIKYSIEETDSNALIKGRSGEVRIKGETVGIIGEVSPEVLAKWELEMPAVILELNLDEIKKITS